MYHELIPYSGAENHTLVPDVSSDSKYVSLLCFASQNQFPEIHFKVW